MTRINLDQAINVGGHITSAAAELDAGRAFVERVEKWGKNGVTTHHLVLIDSAGRETGYFTIGQKAYESRAAKGQNQRPAPIMERTDAPARVTGHAAAPIIDGRVRRPEIEIEDGEVWYRIELAADERDLFGEFCAKFKILYWESGSFGFVIDYDAK